MDTSAAYGRIVALTCCCCGQGTRGRQWWNRDTGFGICKSCADWQKRDGDEDYFRSLYGEEGVFWNV